MTTFRERKTEYYKQQILSWNWDRIESSFEPFTPEFAEDDSIEAVYIGSIFSLTPSGKVYTFWTTNQTGRDIILDECWWTAFEEILSTKKYWHESIDESIFICRHASEIETND